MEKSIYEVGLCLALHRSSCLTICAARLLSSTLLEAGFCFIGGTYEYIFSVVICNGMECKREFMKWGIA